MTCQEFAEVIDDFVDGELPADPMKQARCHEANCCDCARYHESYLHMIELIKNSFRIPLDEDVGLREKRLVDSILAKHPNRLFCGNPSEFR